MKLKFLGSYPDRKHSIYVEEWGMKRMKPGEITEELSMFEASYFMNKYKNVFEFYISEKILTSAENKMLKKVRTKSYVDDTSENKSTS